ncbi:LPD7 domain-containing protein [Massilia sp. CFBP9012]|uniref:LPD7 domain-containing protein n=1 Tax=Massilia sp. CFBP9012 TaxID=3096531 RepID=UPI002A6A546E|nr:LPD7 domain-containing protein [Massilia sp. CFBP9012]MDY0977699.1 LPD7 domain-containing protein [Massilia sp. CFBP9012]
MKPLNEESEIQQPLKAPTDLSTLDWGVMSTLDAPIVDTPGPGMKPKSPRKRIVDEAPKEEGKSKKSRRVDQSEARVERSIVAQESTAPAVKPARAKRAQKQMNVQVTVQAEPVRKPKRASSSKEAKDADVLTEVVGDPNDVPPITASAVKYLGKKNVTLADYIKLDSESLTFVRYHLKRMHQFEGDSQPTGEYADAKTRPVSPALQRFADARAKDLEQIHGTVAVQVSANRIDKVDQMQMRTAVGSYGQKLTVNSTYSFVDVQLRKFELATRRASTGVQTGEVALDDSQRMHRVLGTAQILMANPNRELALVDVTNLVANDIKEVRAIQEVSARCLALSAMIESGLAQPLYHSEFARQAPELVEPATQAHKATRADWGLTYEVISNLSNLVGSEMSLTKDETAALARRTIATIRAIEVPRYRDQALAASHQAALWHPQYRTEFAHNAPDLVALAEVAYRTDDSAPPAGSKKLHMDENSIEQSPLLLVTKAQTVHQNDQAASAVHRPSSSEKVGKEATVSEASDEAAAPSAPGHSGLGRRLLLAIEGAVSQTNTWLSIRRMKSMDSVGVTPVSLEKPTATPVQADNKSSVVPESVARRFLRVETEYYFQDRTPAFSDRGGKLATRSANPEIVRSMVEIAKARGWDTITVKGAEEFRRSTWMEATQLGLTVGGYKPAALDIAALANRPESNTVEKGVAQIKGGVPIQPQARRQSPQADCAHTAGTHATTGHERGSASVRPDQELIAKSKAFEEGKPATVVKKYPDLAKAYGVVAAARAFAFEKLPEASRNEFVEMAKRHMVEKITTGQQIHGPKIYLEPTKTIDARDKVAVATAAVDRTQPPGTKAVNRER